MRHYFLTHKAQSNELHLIMFHLLRLDVAAGIIFGHLQRGTVDRF